MQTDKIKFLVQLTIFFICINSFAQTQGNALFVTFKTDKDFSDESDYHIYKNDSLVYSNCHLKNDINILSHLKKGNYLLKYDTVFGIDSLEFNFKSDFGFKEISLNTEKIDPIKLAQTSSAIESLKNNERITLNYTAGGCYFIKKKEITILKENDEYYSVTKRRKRHISRIRLARIIRYEKEIKNLKFDKNLHRELVYCTYSEFISLTKNGEVLIGKNIFCDTWSKSSEIKKWMY